MPYCPSCGKEVTERDQYCSNCGADITQRKGERDRHRYHEERKACFGPPGSGVGIWGGISGGVFIIGLGILWFFDWWWPGILILIGLMAIIGSLVAYSRR